VRAAARLASIARPSAPPVMKAVLTTPEARPACSGSTSFIATREASVKTAVPIKNNRRWP
jgi:hypothetical protein